MYHLFFILIKLIECFFVVLEIDCNLQKKIIFLFIIYLFIPDVLNISIYCPSIYYWNYAVGIT